MLRIRCNDAQHLLNAGEFLKPTGFLTTCLLTYLYLQVLVRSDLAGDHGGHCSHDLVRALNYNFFNTSSARKSLAKTQELKLFLGGTVQIFFSTWLQIGNK